jgi:hypothetical protein
LLPNELVAVVAELLLRLDVQQNDLAALIHHHHGVWGCLEQAAVPALHLPQMLRGRLAHADVADSSGDQDALGVLERAQHELNGKLTAVLAARRELQPGADLLRERLGCTAGAVRYQPLREAFWDDVAHLLPDELVAVVAELLLRLDVQQNDLAALIHHDHGVGSRFQQAAVPGARLLALAQITAELRKTT